MSKHIKTDRVGDRDEKPEPGSLAGCRKKTSSNSRQSKMKEIEF